MEFSISKVVEWSSDPLRKGQIFCTAEAGAETTQISLLHVGESENRRQANLEINLNGLGLQRALIEEVALEET